MPRRATEPGAEGFCARPSSCAQILDDSTKAHIREKVDAAAAACVEAGHPVQVWRPRALLPRPSAQKLPAPAAPPARPARPHAAQVLRRTNRQGYKAGAMVEGLAHVQPLGFKYCAIFDADFEPPVDFLLETIGPLEDRPDVGFVQTRWLNPYHSFLTWAQVRGAAASRRHVSSRLAGVGRRSRRYTRSWRRGRPVSEMCVAVRLWMQGVALAMHFDVEQRARSYMRWFFNFNGTAGVWRIQVRGGRLVGQLARCDAPGVLCREKEQHHLRTVRAKQHAGVGAAACSPSQAITDAGGWEADTVVEDMDLSLRAYLAGWPGLYLPHVGCTNEVRGSFAGLTFCGFQRVAHVTSCPLRQARKQMGRTCPGPHHRPLAPRPVLQVPDDLSTYKTQQYR